MITPRNFLILIFSTFFMTAACTADVKKTRNNADSNRGSSAVAPDHAGSDAAQPAAGLFKMSELVYIGAFRVPAKANGMSDMNYSQGPIAYAADSHSVFLVGHAHQQAVAEYLVPQIINSKSISQLKMAKPVQEFNPVLDRRPGGIQRSSIALAASLFMMAG